MKIKDVISNENIDFQGAPLSYFLIGLLSAFENRFQAAADSAMKEISWKDKNINERITSIMKSILLENPGNIFCTEIDKPVRKKHEALIRLKAAGICGSDIGAFRGTNKLVSYPRVIGHELAGIIEEIDEDNPRGFKKGDRVIVDPYLYCGSCYPCSIGRTNCCTDLHVLGVVFRG